MASLCRDKNGGKRILFMDGDGDRRTLRLGTLSVKAAESVRLRVEALIAARFAGTPIDAETARWLADLPDVMHARIVRAGLADAREKMARVTLGGLLEAFMASRDVKPSTLVRMNQVRTALLGHFGESRPVASITEPNAEAWRAALRSDGYAVATVSRTVVYARQVFRWAVRRGMAAGNPFAEVKAGAQANPARLAFIDRATIARVLDACPDAEWRLLVALSRFGGLRVPSEAFALRWEHVDWSGSRLLVPSPKTEHHDGKGERVVPLFPELLVHVQAAFDAAPEGAVYLLDRLRRTTNPATHFRRIIRRAGVTPWPKAWHNLRASRQTELAADFPLHTVCAWIGNSRAVAAGHYLQVTDADWQRATGGAECGALGAQNAAQRPAALACAGARGSQETTGIPDVTHPGAHGRTGVPIEPMGQRGLEPPTSPLSGARSSQLSY